MPFSVRPPIIPSSVGLSPPAEAFPPPAEVTPGPSQLNNRAGEEASFGPSAGEVAIQTDNASLIQLPLGDNHLSSPSGVGFEHASRFLDAAEKGASKTSIVVVGAGPAGLAAAIESAQRGAQVTLVEKRSEPSRPVVLNLRKAGVQALETLGVDGAGLKPLRKIKLVPSMGRPQVIKPQELKEELGAKSPGAMLGEPCVAQTTIASLEKAMLARAVELKVKIYRESELRLSDHGSVDVVSTIAPNTVIEAGLEPRLLVAADGSNSHLRTQAGIGVASQGKGTWFMGSVLDPKAQPKQGQGEFKQVERWSSIHGPLLAARMRPDQNASEWLLVEIPQPGLLKNPFDYYLTEAGKFHGKKFARAAQASERSPLDVQWGNLRPFRVQNRRAISTCGVVNGIPTVLTGQAARDGHFLVSAGALLAITHDREALGSLVEAMLKPGEGAVRSHDLYDYVVALQEGTIAWHAASQHLFHSDERTWSAEAPGEEAERLLRKVIQSQLAYRLSPGLNPTREPPLWGLISDRDQLTDALIEKASISNIQNLVRECWNLNEVDGTWNGVMHWVPHFARPSQISLIYEAMGAKGTNFHIGNHHGNTPAHVVMQRPGTAEETRSTLEVLARYGADLNAQNKFGQTPVSMFMETFPGKYLPGESPRCELTQGW